MNRGPKPTPQLRTPTNEPRTEANATVKDADEWTEDRSRRHKGADTWNRGAQESPNPTSKRARQRQRQRRRQRQGFGKQPCVFCLGIRSLSCTQKLDQNDARCNITIRSEERAVGVKFWYGIIWTFPHWHSMSSDWNLIRLVGPNLIVLLSIQWSHLLVTEI